MSGTDTTSVRVSIDTHAQLSALAARQQAVERRPVSLRKVLERIVAEAYARRIASTSRDCP